MNFGDAIEALKNGDRVTRAGWNGKGMWLTLMRPTDEDYDGKPWHTLQPYIAMKTAQDNLVAWTASQSDCLAEDWERNA